MIPEHESAPPIRNLPAEIEAAMENYYNAVRRFVADEDRASYKVALHNLTETIRAALDDQDAALRERCERLRQVALLVNASAEIHAKSHDIYMSDAFFEALRLGDLADNLIPRGGGER